MFHLKALKSRFRLSVSEYNKIVAFLNNLCQGWGIKLQRPDSPSVSTPPMVEVDRKVLDEFYMSKEISAPQNPTELSSGYPEGSTAEQKTDTFTASTAANAKGVKVFLLCRGADAQDGEHIVFAWRPFLITPDGRVYSIGADSGTRTSVYTDQG